MPYRALLPVLLLAACTPAVAPAALAEAPAPTGPDAYAMAVEVALARYEAEVEMAYARTYPSREAADAVAISLDEDYYEALVARSLAAHDLPATGLREAAAGAAPTAVRIRRARETALALTFTADQIRDRVRTIEVELPDVRRPAERGVVVAER